ncbi:MAG: rhodanese-like domain-containing protein [Desulfomonile sp.]|nr:rhodanese-like domain-containing protein [Desulfomonile sp.]
MSTNLKNGIKVICRALIMSVLFGAIGPMINLMSQRPLPWVYVAPKEVMVAGVKVSLVDEKEARQYFDDGSTVFVDSRKCDDYAKAHVKGAICFPPESAEERFPATEPLLPLDSRIILYCYGPECDMAERVGEFLGRRGYKNMLIMSSGFAAWERAGFPVERSIESGTSPEDGDFGIEGSQALEHQVACRGSGLAWRRNGNV